MTLIEIVISLAAVVGLFGITVAVFDHEASELLAVAKGCARRPLTAPGLPRGRVGR